MKKKGSLRHGWDKALITSQCHGTEYRIYPDEDLSYFLLNLKNRFNQLIMLYRRRSHQHTAIIRSQIEINKTFYWKDSHIQDSPQSHKTIGFGKKIMSIIYC